VAAGSPSIAQPRLQDLAVLEPKQLQPAHRDTCARRREAGQVAGMRGMVGPAFGDHIPFGHQPVSRDMQVRAAGKERAQRRFEPVAVAHMRGRGIVVHVGRGEELVSRLDVALVIELPRSCGDDGLVLLS